MIQVNGLIKNYGKFRALDNVSFEIKKGDIIGLLGPNGAGKTTLMRILTGYIPASYGNTLIAGMDISDHPREIKKMIGYLPENCPLYPEMTVYDYLKSMAEIRGIRGAELKRRLDYVFEALKISDRRNHVIGTLSKGYKQRVGLAQSLVHDPDILILDEPTVGLDPHQIIEFRDLIQNLKGDRTVILSTHILTEVSQSCERIIVISKGRVVAEGSESNLINSISNEQKLMVRVRENHQKAEELIRQIDGVKEVRGDGNDLTEITLEKDKDPWPRIAKNLVESDFVISEFREKKMTLEDIFISLTKGN